MTGDIEGRRVVVTGGSSGIGAASASALADAGARVAVLARRERELTEIASRIGACAIVVDVTDPSATTDAVDRAATALGGVDVLVNCAGLAIPGSIAEAEPDEWRQMLETNVLGLLHVTSAALPHLQDGAAPQVITVSSMAAHRLPGTRTTVYSASKAAGHVVTQGMRGEFLPLGIRVTLVTPGFVETPLLERVPPDRLAGLRRHDVANLSAEHVAAQVLHVVSQPPEVSIAEIAVLPAGQT